MAQISDETFGMVLVATNHDSAGSSQMARCKTASIYDAEWIILLIMSLPAIIILKLDINFLVPVANAKAMRLV